MPDCKKESPAVVGRGVKKKKNPPRGAAGERKEGNTAAPGAVRRTYFCQVRFL